MKYDALKSLADCMCAALWHYGRGSQGREARRHAGAAVDQIRAINRQSARALGIKVPPGLRSVADEVIK